VVETIRGLIGLAKELFDTFITGVANTQRLTTQLGNLMGSADGAKDYIAKLSDENLKLGVVTADMLPSINKAAMAFKGLDGSVSPEKMDKFINVMRRIKAARPDLEMTSIADAIIKTMSGDANALKHILGLGLEDIKGLSAESQKTLAAIQESGDTQLGQVTRLGAAAKPSTEAMLDLLNEVTDKMGMATEQLTGWELQVARLAELWNQFKETVGAPILEVLITELGKFSDWLLAHKDDVERLAKKLGEMTAKGLQAAMEWLMKVDWEAVGAGAERFVDALGSIDWEGIGKTIQLFMNLATIAAQLAVLSPTGQAAQLGFKIGQSMAAPAAAEIPDQWHEPSRRSGKLDLANQVNVVISIDDDMKLRAAVKRESMRAAAETTAGLVKSATERGIHHN